MSSLTTKLQLFSSQLNNLNIVPGLCLWGFHAVYSWNGVKCILPTHSSVLHANINSSVCWRQWLLKSNKLCLFKLGSSIHSTRAGDSSEVIIKDEHLSLIQNLSECIFWMNLMCIWVYLMSEMVTTLTHRYCPCCGLDTWLPQALFVPVCTIGFTRHGFGFLFLVYVTTWKSCCVNQRLCLSIGRLKWAEPLLFHCMLDLSCRCYWDVSAPRTQWWESHSHPTCSVSLFQGWKPVTSYWKSEGINSWSSCYQIALVFSFESDILFFSDLLALPDWKTP